MGNVGRIESVVRIELVNTPTYLLIENMEMS